MDIHSFSQDMLGGRLRNSSGKSNPPELSKSMQRTTHWSIISSSYGKVFLERFRKVRAVNSHETLVISRHRKRWAWHQKYILLLHFFYKMLEVRKFRVICPNEHSALRGDIELPTPSKQWLLGLNLLSNQLLLHVLHMSCISSVGQNSIDESFAKRRNCDAG